MNWNQIFEWFMELGEPYGVDPFIFGLIYVGAIPFFWIAVTWLVYNVRRERSVTDPILMACGCAVSAYVYLIVSGENVPFWVYGVVAGIIVYAIFATIKKVNKITDEVSSEETV